MLIAGGNLSWLNWLTVVLAFTTIDDRLLSWLPVTLPTRQPIPRFQQMATGGLAIMVVLLSIAPVMNMLSPGQVMNTSFNPLQIVNTHGAFGSVSKERNEIILEGSAPTQAVPPIPISQSSLRGNCSSLSAPAVCSAAPRRRPQWARSP